MRSLDDILSHEKPSTEHELSDRHGSEFRDKLPDAEPESAAEPQESRSEEHSDPKKVEAQPKTKAPAVPATKREDDDEEQDAPHEPVDLEGYKRALTAARGDKRKARKKWQEAERKLAQYEGRMQAMQQAPRPEPQARQEEKPKPKPEKLGDQLYTPDSMEIYLEAREQAVVEKLEAEFARHQAQINEREDRRRRKSVDRARARHEDFDEAFAAAVEMARSNPALEAQLLDEDDVGEAAYQQGKTYLDLRGVNSLDDLRAKIRAEIEAERDAEQAQTPQLTQPQQASATRVIPPAPPKSIAGARGTGAGATPQYKGPRPLSEILG